jgi:hypothetical protein
MHINTLMHTCIHICIHINIHTRRHWYACIRMQACGHLHMSQYEHIGVMRRACLCKLVCRYAELSEALRRELMVGEFAHVSRRNRTWCRVNMLACFSACLQAKHHAQVRDAHAHAHPSVHTRLYWVTRDDGSRPRVLSLDSRRTCAYVHALRHVTRLCACTETCDMLMCMH